MRFVPDHRIVFECVNDDNIEMPIIINAIYIYKIGDKFRIIDFGENEDEIINDFIVTDVKLEIRNILDGEQDMITYVEKI